MDISGSHRIPAPAAAVWAGLHDPAVLKACVGGCERLETTAGGAFEGAVAAKVGPIRGVFEGRLTATSAEPPRRCAIAVEARDPAAGGGRGSGEVTLAEDGGWTTLAYSGEAEADGKIGQLGQRLVAGFIRASIESFFTRFAELAAEGGLPAGDAPGSVAVEPPPLAEAPPLAPDAPAPSSDGEPERAPDAPPLAEGPGAAPMAATPIAPTATPAVPDPAALAAASAADAPKEGGRPVIRVMLVAAIAVLVGVAGYWALLQPPG